MIWIVLAAYGTVQLAACVIGWRSKMMSRGAFITMAAGSLLLIAGSWLDWKRAAASLWLIGIGLYLISDSAYAVGTKRPSGPRISHHIARAALGLVLFGGAVYY